MKHDLIFTLRQWRKTPGFIALALLALALGIGANAAIFSVLDASLFRPLPYEQPDRLVVLWEENPERDWVQSRVAPANYLDWLERNTAFSDIAAYGASPNSFTLTGGGEPERIDAGIVTANYFSVLGEEPLLGRGFRAEENWTGNDTVVVLSHGFWQRRFGGDRDVIGKTLTLNGYDLTVIGVMPPDFRHLIGDVDLWATYGWDPTTIREAQWARNAHFLQAVGRLKPGVTPEQASAELASLARQIEREHPETNAAMGAGLTPLDEWVSGDSRTPLIVLLGAVAAVLLIACANVANLLLARARTRNREIAIRSAIGAGRRRIVRQLLTESILLAVAGGLLGLVLGAVGVRVLNRVALDFLPQMNDVQLDLRVLLFVTAVTLVTGVLFGLAPALTGSRTDLVTTLKESGRGTAGASSRWARDGLVIFEVALALLLVVGAGLLIVSLDRLQQVDPGFDTEELLVLKVSLPSSQYPDGTAVSAFYRELTARLEGLPGVESAAAAMNLPLTEEHWTTDFMVEGQGRENLGLNVHHNSVTPGYFESMGLDLLAGRALDASDGPDAPPRLVVNQTLAERYFPRTDAVGRRISFDTGEGSDPVWWTIVGVVEDEKQQDLAGEVEPAVYRPSAQWPRNTMNVLVRTAGAPLGLIAPVRAVVRQLDPNLATYEVRTMQQVWSDSLQRQRFVTLLLGLFALLALVQAAIGIYGVLAYGVNQRVREIGVRMAFGARARDVLVMIVRQGLVLIGVGLVIGLAIALWATRSLSSLLYGVGAFDPAVVGAVAAILVLVGLAACYFPARRAARLDPMQSLRVE